MSAYHDDATELRNEQRYPFIVLNTGDIVLVEEQDFERIAQYSWHLTNTGYAAARLSRDQGRKLVLMHRFILNPPAKAHVDHINANKLDNRRSNLRAVRASVNLRNVHHLNANNTSGIRGVCWDKTGKYWMAYISVQQKRIYLGYFQSKDEAIAARIAGELKYWGELCPTSQALIGPVDPQPIPLLGRSGPVRTFHRKSHCLYGHVLSEDNLYINKQGYRSCRTCRASKRHRKGASR